MAGGKSRSKSDLATRTLSALVMLAVAGFALWAGELVWAVFVLIVGIGVWFEWSALVLLMYPPGRKRTMWRYGGAVYCGIACAVLLTLRDWSMGAFLVLLIIGAVIGTDVGAYFAGRAIGGPKIAPRISPSKTWAGLFGGIIGSTVAIGLGSIWLNFRVTLWDGGSTDEFFGLVASTSWIFNIILGALIAIIAQAGDFFESWMKRKAGVKDSGKMLPGHGGLFDRLDGLLLVLVVIGNLFIFVDLSVIL